MNRFSQVSTGFAAANAATLTATVQGVDPPIASALFQFSGTYGTAVVKFQGQLFSGGEWVDLAASLISTPYTLVTGNISLVDNSSPIYRVISPEGLFAARAFLVSMSSGTIVTNCTALTPADVATQILPMPITIATTAQTITVASATALVVGANGATNPVLAVNTNTASVATGITIIGAAAAGGVAMTVTSSGANEPLVVNAKGTGTITLNNTATGGVIIGSATGRSLVMAGTLTAGGLLGASVQICTSGPLIYSGSGAPTISAAVQGSVYLRTDGSTTSTRFYVATNTAGTWTAVTTAA